jgi:hypothetical protein
MPSRCAALDFSPAGELSSMPMPVLPGPGAVPRASGLPAAGGYRVRDVEVGIGRPAKASRLRVEPRADTGLWLTDDVVADPVTAWRRLVDLYAETGLWPLLLASLAADYDHRPWHSGELEPVPLTRVDALEAAAVLAEGWADSLVPMGENPYVQHLQPYGASFPGLAAPLGREPTPAPAAVPVDALHPWMPRRLGLVPCRRPADAVALIGWHGAINSRSPEQVSAVLRSWEDRLGVVLAELRFATLTLLVPHPPGDESEALPIAAELAALCPDVLSQDGPVDGLGHLSGGTVAGLARALVDRPVWTLWWD